MLSYFTAGESHGKGIITIIKGLPAGIEINRKEIESELNRRRLAEGRGPRMNKECDEPEIISGIRHGRTIGSPISILVRNKVNTIDELAPLTKVRPGHIDLAVAMKLLTLDGRTGAERASARETVGRVIAGSIAQSLLNHFNIHIHVYVTRIGPIPALPVSGSYHQLKTKRDNYFHTLDRNIIPEWQKLLYNARKKGDTLGGIFEVIGFNIPVGLGDHTHWEDRLDARLAQAVMAIPAVKGVEIGLGFDYSNKPGSQAMDLFSLKNNKPQLNKYGGWKRMTNYAGGIEGGLSNGEPIIIRATVKPIPTLGNPVQTIDLVKKRKTMAITESADICAVPAASVIGGAVVSFEIARAFINKFGADTLLEMTGNFKNYLRLLRKMF
ncbi:MAG: chorismate synthase [Planctomycetota bacterium]|nr:chorismate synthase [Planctomycetota bacterium]MDI6788385.1 chorismate synthase [Planctomycetota bacterium]